MTRLSAITCCLVLIMLSGCASSPVARYYLLEAQARHVSYDGGLSVGLHPVIIPEYLRRSSILTNAADGSLTFSAEGRWGEPLADGVYRVSVIDLANQLETGELLAWPWSAGDRPQVEIRVGILTLDRDEREAILTADVEMLDRGNDPGNWRHFVRTWRTETADRSDGATAAAYSRLIQIMNRDIAAAVTNL